jgi:hypothetical protein
MNIEYSDFPELSIKQTSDLMELNKFSFKIQIGLKWIVLVNNFK